MQHITSTHNTNLAEDPYKCDKCDYKTDDLETFNIFTPVTNVITTRMKRTKLVTTVTSTVKPYNCSL